jgi:hypothetical protein
MKTKTMFKRFGPTVAVFSLVSVGALLALPDNDSADADKDLVPVLVAKDALPSGTPTGSLADVVEVRDVPRPARAEGALDSVGDIPEGVLAYDHVVGQQLLVTSFADDAVAAVGAGRVSVSVRVDSQRWVGPFNTTGTVVDVYAIDENGATKISSGAVILGSPSTEDLTPKQDSIVSLAVREETLQAVLVAASENRLWMVGA